MKKYGVHPRRVSDKQYDKEMAEFCLRRYPALTGIDGNLMTDYLLEQAPLDAFVCVLTLEDNDFIIWRSVIRDVIYRMRGKNFAQICKTCGGLYNGEDPDGCRKRKAAAEILNGAITAVDGDSGHKSLFARFDTMSNAVKYKPDKLKKQYLLKYLQSLRKWIRLKEKNHGRLKAGQEWGEGNCQN